MTPEAKVKNKVKKILDEYGVYHFSPQTGGYGRAGIPDIICCADGKFIGIECKAGKGRCTALQLRELEKIKFAGGEALIINENNLEEIEKCLTSSGIRKKKTKMRATS